jgi:hypothetical protein
VQLKNRKNTKKTKKPLNTTFFIKQLAWKLWLHSVVMQFLVKSIISMQIDPWGILEL